MNNYEIVNNSLSKPVIGNETAIQLNGLTNLRIEVVMDYLRDVYSAVLGVAGVRFMYV